MSSSTTESGAKPKEFQAEVAKLLHLMVHSVYSEREVFLRELISNASDACDKLRYEALKNDKLMQTGGDLRITISLDKKAKTLTITDTGIGMDAKELADNLGTIARSGTQAFMEQVETGKKKGEKDVNLIGQFGVGFYSSFMIAEHVDVVSRKAGTKKANIWSSDGTGTYTVAAYDGDDAPERPIPTMSVIQFTWAKSRSIPAAPSGRAPSRRSAKTSTGNSSDMSPASWAIRP
jgi:molecular chaperone HtpG